MKRGFLFGLGSFLVLVVLAGLLELWKGEHLISALMIVPCAPLSVVAIRKANAAAPNKSGLHAFGGWLIGFCFMPVALFTLMLAAGAISFLAR